MLSWTWILLVVVVFAVVGDGDPFDGASEVLNTVTRGKRLTHATYGADGVVNFNPEELAATAGATLDAYALARMISSEEGNAGNATKAAIALVAVNKARRSGKSISELLLHAVNASHDGYFGTQRDIDQDSDRFRESDRYASTALDPYAGDLKIAEGVLSGSIADFTMGAIQFDNLNAFENQASADRTAANRLKEGRVQVYPPGVPENLRFWA